MILTEDKMKVSKRYANLLVLLILVVGLQYFTAAQTNMTVIVTFDQAPATATAIKAPLKYNKDFAFSMQIDDGDESIFSKAYPMFMGGTIENQTYPGLVYTDGCGNDINFKMSTAQFVFNQNDENGPDIHDPESGYSSIKVTWPQMDTLYKAGWGIYNHGVNGNASSDADFMNFSIKRNKSYTRRKLYNTTEGGVLTRIHVNPNGSTPWTQACFNLGYNAALNQNSFDSFMGDNGGNVNSSGVDWSQPQSLFRLNNGEINVPDYVQGLADSSNNGANYWGIVLTHSIGDQYPLPTFLSDFSSIAATYGKNGQDNILMSTDEEIIDYLIIREALNVNSVLVGNNLILTINGNVPDDLRFYALSLVINADQNISNITVTGADSVNQTAYGNNEGLINLFWDGEIIIPSDVLADSMTTIAVNTQTQRDAWIAMDYVACMENNNHKDSLRSVLCGIPGNTYDAGFCDFLLDLGPDTTICQYDCDTIYGPDGYNTYTWMVADTVYDTIQNINVCPIDTTAYILLAENDFGVLADTIVYNVIKSPTVDLGNDTTICQSDSITLYGPDSTGLNYTFEWFVADTLFDTTQNIIVSPVDTTQYILWVNTLMGCSNSDSLWVNVLPSPTVNLGNDTTLCKTNSITLYGPDTTGLDYTFEWFVADTLFDTTQNITVSPIDTTMYLLLVNSSTGCSNSDSLWINVLPIPIFEILPSDTSYICSGDSLEFIANGNNEGLSYLWNTGDTIQSIKVSPDISDSLYKYYVDVSNNYSCVLSDTAWLSTYAVPEVSFPYDTIEACFGEEIKLAAFVDNPLIVSNYIWYYADNIDTTSTAIYNINAEESIIFYLQIITTNDCEVWDSVFVDVNQSAEISTSGNKVICAGDTTTLEVNGADYYYWIVGQDTISTESTVDVFPQDTTKYIVVGEMENGCSATDSIFIYTLASPETQIIYDGNNPVCQNSVITLVANGADTYFWNTEETTEEINITIESETFIELTGELTNGCASKDTITIGVLEAIPATLNGLLPVYCENDPPELLTGTPAGGTFSGSGIVGDEFKPSAAGPGTYKIVYSYDNENGCMSTDTATTTVYSNESAIDIGQDQNIYPSESIELDAGPGFDSYYWSTGSKYQNITIYYGDYPPGSIIRYVVIAVKNSCTSQGEVYITFADPDGVGEFENKKYLLYPNPNTGTFTVSYLEEVREFQIVIYDYHGRIILNQSVECNPDCDAKIDLPKLPKGLYLIKTISEKGISSGKIIIK